jgi:hypothetical protein
VCRPEGCPTNSRWKQAAECRNSINFHLKRYRAGREDQTVEHLPSKYKAMSSNLSTAKKDIETSMLMCAKEVSRWLPKILESVTLPLENGSKGLVK